MKHAVFAALAATAAAAPVASKLAAATSHDEFAAWKLKHGKEYDAEEHTKRARIFAENVAFIRAENNKGHSYRLGVGPFASCRFPRPKATTTSPICRRRTR
eukprot:COSAG04_NODE_2979_length_3322_cov_1.833075_3_plen_101_part_00